MTKPLLHVCFVSREFGSGGGIGTYVWEMAAGLAAAGHAVTVISDGRLRVDRQPPGGVVSIRVVPRTPSSRRVIWRVDRRLPWFALAAARALWRLTKTRTVDLVETAEFDADGLVAGLLPRRYPIVVRLHSARRLIDDIAPPQAPATTSYWFERSVLVRADAITSPSVAIVGKTFDLFGLPRRACSVIPNPIHLGTQPEVTRTPGEVAYVGRLETRKGVVALAAAVPIVLNQRPDLRFVFVGADGQHPEGGSFRHHIRSQVAPELRDRVQFEELARHQVPVRLAQSDLSIFPSLWENFPYTLLESMSVGTPAIVSPYGGMPEVVTHLENGIVLAEPTAANIAAGILEACRDRERLERMRTRAKETIDNRYRTDIVVAQMVAAYRRFIDEKARR